MMQGFHNVCGENVLPRGLILLYYLHLQNKIKTNKWYVYFCCETAITCACLNFIHTITTLFLLFRRDLMLYWSINRVFQSCFLTQDSGTLVGSIGERPVRSVVIASQVDVQLTSEGLTVTSCKQPAALKEHKM